MTTCLRLCDVNAIGDAANPVNYDDELNKLLQQRHKLSLQLLIRLMLSKKMKTTKQLILTENTNKS